MARPDLHGQVCLITGATAGIGAVTARELARIGASVVIVSRNEAKCQSTVARIKQDTQNPHVDYIQADLSAMDEVRRVAETFRARYDRLDVLVNNVGALFTTRQETVDGFEKTFALNHLSYFLLTVLLLDILKASAPARIVNVSSSMHTRGTIPFDDLFYTQGYSGWGAYGDSKFANVLFTYELARRLDGTGVTANALHPGTVATDFLRSAGVGSFGGLTPEEGAETTFYLASSPEVEDVTGQYFERKQATRTVPASYDEDTARRLWDVSAELVGVSGTV
jgi:retinol dehydrogenase-12